jgi:hypothetical protein
MDTCRNCKKEIKVWEFTRQQQVLEIGENGETVPGPFYMVHAACPGMGTC